MHSKLSVSLLNAVHSFLWLIKHPSILRVNYTHVLVVLLEHVLLVDEPDNLVFRQLLWFLLCFLGLLLLRGRVRNYRVVVVLFLFVSVEYLFKVVVLDLNLVQVCFPVLDVRHLMVLSVRAFVAVVEELRVKLDKRGDLLLWRLVIILAEAFVVELHVLVDPKKEIRIRSEVHALLLLVAIGMRARLRQSLLRTGQCCGCYVDDVFL